MSRLVLLFFFMISLSSTHAISAQANASDMGAAESVEEKINPYLLGTCETIAVLNLQATEIQIKEVNQSSIAFYITTSAGKNLEYFCYECANLSRADNIILTRTNDISLACLEEEEKQ